MSERGDQSQSQSQCERHTTHTHAKRWNNKNNRCETITSKSIGSIAFIRIPSECEYACSCCFCRHWISSDDWIAAISIEAKQWLYQFHSINKCAESHFWIRKKPHLYNNNLLLYTLCAKAINDRIGIIIVLAALTKALSFFKIHAKRSWYFF